MKEVSKIRNRVLQYLFDNGSITSWEAIKELGCTRLSEYIRQLRYLNYNIKSEWQFSINRYGKKIKYVKYIIEGND